MKVIDIKSKMIALGMIAKMQIQMAFVYRLNYFFGILSLFLPIAASYFIWDGVYSNIDSTTSGYDLQSILIYSIVGVGLRLTTNSTIINMIESLVNTGNISLELLKPLSFQARLLFADIGMTIRRVITEFMVVFILSIFLFKLDLSIIKFVNLAYFSVMITLGFILIFLIDYIVGLISFWLTQLWGINFAKRQMMSVFSGSLIPLSMYPAQLVTILEITPFPYIFGFPLDALVKGITPQRFMTIVTIDVVWIIGLFIVGRIIWHFGSKKVFVQGG